ncbi:hypothetical protein WEB32_29755 [Streptomyces netropsis]|uniref:hypothetical protein n=1 Tax=Streptomyces netropsis TaxID=55404 RepID=UPI0030D193AC
MATAMTLVPTTQAEARPSSSHVQVVGQAAHCTNGKEQIVERVLIQAANGEAAEVTGVRLHLTGLYLMDFYKVPKNGELANAYVFCSDSASKHYSYAKTVHITRPASLISDTLFINLKP